MMLQTAGAVKSILVVDRHRADASRLARELPCEKYSLTVAECVEQAEELIHGKDYDAAIIEVDIPTRCASFELLRKLRREHPFTKVIMMTDYGDEELWVDALTEGACDLVAKPVLRRDVERRLLG